MSDAFILAKTVTYVSSLPVTYVTTLYKSAARHVPNTTCVVEWYHPPDRSFRANAVSRGIFPSCRFYLAAVHYPTWWIPPLRLRDRRNDIMGGRFRFSSVTVPSFRVLSKTPPWLSLWESWLGTAETERALGRLLNDNVIWFSQR